MFNNEDREWLDSIKEDVISRLEDRIGGFYYVDDIGFTITENENVNGSWYCNAASAKEDIINHWDVFGSLYEKLKQDGLEVKWNPFYEEELFHCSCMIELYRILFDNAAYTIGKCGERLEIDEEFIDEIKEALYSDELDWDELL